MNLILASKSPRRKEILENLGVKFEIKALDTDESTDQTDPEKYVTEISRRKGEAVKDKLISEDSICSKTIILSCDTVVVSPEGEIMGKPKNRDDARRMLLSYSGKVHRVISGIALATKEKTVCASETTYVYFDKPDEKEIEEYISGDEPFDKAGAYAIQGRASLWIDKIDGDYFNVVGLPIKKVSDLMKDTFGISLSEFIE